MQGYMRKRGSRRVRGSDKRTTCWRLFVELGRRADGKRERRTKTVYGTEREAAKELRSLLREVDNSVRSDPSKVRVSDFLLQWLEHKTDLEVGTREKYEGIIKQHLIPAFGRLKLDRLDRLAIRSRYALWQKEGKLAGKGGLAPATIRKQHAILREALQTAFDDGLVARNMAVGVSLPKGETRERRALSADEYAQVLDAARGSRMYAPIILGLATGMRRGELLALTWKDLEHGRLLVRRSLELSSTGLRFKAPKSGRMRVITLPAIAVSVLADHRIAQNKERLRCGEAWLDNDLVFAGIAGGAWHPNNFSRDFRHCAVNAGLGSIGPHTLRHTAATEMLRQGLHPKVVADRLGHATTRMTLDIYSHVSPQLEADAAQKVNMALSTALAEKALPA